VSSYLTHNKLDDSGFRFTATGDWVVTNAASIFDEMASVEGRAGGDRIIVDTRSISSIDSSGAWLVHRLKTRLENNGHQVQVVGLDEQWQALYDRVGALESSDSSPDEDLARRESYVERLGRRTIGCLQIITDFVAFLGEWSVSLGRAILNPRRFRLKSIVFHLEHVGFDALPIVGLIAFLIGVVLAYQGTLQLRMFGAEIYTIDLIAISVLRELGILLTAIVVAGRTASAYAAELGSMKVNEEVDAIRTLGLDPVELLVRPRVIALLLAMPILTLFANFCGLLGGGVMAWIVLDIDPVLYLSRLQDAVTIDSFWVGMIKAPVFGLVIALVGCFEGMQVSGSADSVGKHTTRSVVEAIFLVIVMDAMFSILFGFIGY